MDDRNGHLRSVLLSGTFHGSSGHLEVDGTPVEPQLEELSGRNVHFALHYLPPAPLDVSRWGFGCCTWQPNPCPVGHHEDPGKMLVFSAEGLLEKQAGEWVISSAGNLTRIPLGFLDGHNARLVVVPKFDPGKSSGSVQGLMSEAENLKRILDAVQNHLKERD